MDTNFSPLLPAFQLLWNAAQRESQTDRLNDCVNANYGQCKQNKMMNGSSTQISDETFLRNESHQSNCVSHEEEIYCNGNVVDSEEGVVVCTLECDHGDKFVRQIIHDGTARSQWSRAEDVFVDWLNNDLTCQHAQRIDVTVYFCRVPVSTSSDGIYLWVKNLVDEGKEVNVKIKVASMGPGVSRALEGIPSNCNGKGRFHEVHRLNELEDTTTALRRLAKMGAQIEPVSSGDWVQLLSLLTDRASLQALDLKRGPHATALSTLLQATL